MSLPLFCNVCRGEIPEARRNRKATTCSTECHRKLRLARRRELIEKRCPACGIPSNPVERRLFKQWRDSTGESRRRGKPKRIEWAKRLAAMNLEWPEGAEAVLIFDASTLHQATVTREQFDKVRAAAIAKQTAAEAA